MPCDRGELDDIALVSFADNARRFVDGAFDDAILRDHQDAMRAEALSATVCNMHEMWLQIGFMWEALPEDEKSNAELSDHLGQYLGALAAIDVPRNEAILLDHGYEEAANRLVALQAGAAAAIKRGNRFATRASLQQDLVDSLKPGNPSA